MFVSVLNTPLIMHKICWDWPLILNSWATGAIKYFCNKIKLNIFDKLRKLIPHKILWVIMVNSFMKVVLIL